MRTTRRHISSGPVPTLRSKETYEALWWLSDRPEDRVPGRAVFHPENGLHLILNGTFEGHGQDQTALANAPTILGQQYTGACFTLLECQEYERNVPFGWGFPRQKFVADRAIIGYHFERPEDAQFEKLYMEATHLKDWMRNVGLHRPERVEDGFFIEYDPDLATTVSELQANLCSATIAVKSKPTRLGGNTVEDPAGVEISEWIEIAPHFPVDLKEAIDSYIDPLLDLLSLATGAPNSLLRLEPIIRSTRQRPRSSTSIFIRQRSIRSLSGEASSIRDRYCFSQTM